MHKYTTPIVFLVFHFIHPRVFVANCMPFCPRRCPVSGCDEVSFPQIIYLCLLFLFKSCPLYGYLMSCVSTKLVKDLPETFFFLSLFPTSPPSPKSLLLCIALLILVLSGIRHHLSWGQIVHSSAFFVPALLLIGEVNGEDKKRLKVVFNQGQKGGVQTDGPTGRLAFYARRHRWPGSIHGKRQRMLSQSRPLWGPHRYT